MTRGLENREHLQGATKGKIKILIVVVVLQLICF